MIYARATFTLGDGDMIASDAAFDLQTGAKLWGPVNRTVAGSRAGLAISDDVFVDWQSRTFQLTAFNVKNGQVLWTAETNKDAFEYHGTRGTIAYGKLYVNSYSGYVYAFDLQTGNRDWTFFDGSSGFETPTGSWQLYNDPIIADGKIYIPSGDVEPFTPYWRGYTMICLNTTTGQEIWRSLGSFQTQTPNTMDMALADGYLVGMNMYDNRLYAYGKGPSATTVTAPDVGVTTSTPITITGAVTDISAGSQQDAVAANYPNGLPCVSDASMSQFMEAVYEQQPMPTNVTGVTVTLSVLDSNGNYRQIGTTVSNAMGTYDLTWTPDIPGDYAVIANFAGSGSYYGSSAQTYFYASSPSATASPYPVTVLPPTEMYFAISTVVIIVAIAIVGLVIVMQLRKRS